MRKGQLNYSNGKVLVDRIFTMLKCSMLQVRKGALTFEHTSLMEICSEWDFRLYVKSEKSEFEPWHIKELKIVFFSFPKITRYKSCSWNCIWFCVGGTHFDIALTCYKSCWRNRIWFCVGGTHFEIALTRYKSCWRNRIWVCVGGTHFDIALTSEKQRILFQILDVSLLRPGRDSDAIWPSCLRCLVLLINHGDS